MYEISERGSSTRLEDARRAGAQHELLGLELAPIAAATVSALMLSSMPWSSADSGLTTGTRPLSSSLHDDARVDAVDVADEAVVDRLAVDDACTGGRLCAWIRPASTPLTPTAGDVQLAADREDARVDQRR